MRNLALELVKRGNELEVLTSYEAALPEDKFKLTYTSIPVYAQHQTGYNIIWDYVQKYRPDIIITHHFFAGEFPEIFTSFGLPTVEVIHSRPRTPTASLAVFNSNYTATTPGQLRLPQDMVILPMANPEHKADSHENAVLHIKPIGGKGIMMTYALAKAFPNRKFVVLRGEWQGAETMISGLSNLEYMEPVKDIRDFYKRGNLLLMPSEREEAGTVPFEATLNGLPCISSDVMGLPETNRGGIILPINSHPWDNDMPMHPDNESITRWIAEINKLDDPSYYNQVVQRQKDFMASIPYSGLFDELNSKMQDAIRDFRRV
jgi:hypothetical protein